METAGGLLGLFVLCVVSLAAFVSVCRVGYAACCWLARPIALVGRFGLWWFGLFQGSGRMAVAPVEAPVESLPRVAPGVAPPAAPAVDPEGW